MSAKLLGIFVSAFLVNNFTLSYFLGLCPFFGVSGRLQTAFRLGVANTFVLIITSLATWALNTYVLVHAPYLAPDRLHPGDRLDRAVRRDGDQEGPAGAVSRARHLSCR